MFHELRHAEYLISDDPTRLDVTAIHAYLSRSYWAENISREIVARAVKNSLCVGIYGNENRQVGLVRAITDYATFAYLCDVFVLEEHRRRGLGRAAVGHVLSHPRLQGLRRVQLVTHDAHGLYAPFGFKALDRPERHMEKRLVRAYSA